MLPKVVEEVRSLPFDSLVLDTEAVWWSEGAPIPRHAMVGIVVRKEPFVEEDLRFNVHDALYVSPGIEININGKKETVEGDITEQPWYVRQQVLKKVLPKDLKHLKRVEGKIVTNKQEFLRALEWASAYPGSEGAMGKLTTGPYITIGREPRTPDWFKYKLIREYKGLVIGRSLKSMPWPQKPKENLTGEEAIKAYKQLQEKSRTWILRVAVKGPGHKYTPIESEKILAPGDVNLRWDAERSEWGGTECEAIWEMAKGWEHRKPGERAYGNTYGRALEPAPKLGDIVTVAPILMKEERDPQTGRAYYSHMFPRLKEIDPERTQPDTIADIKRIARETAKRTPGRREVKATVDEMLSAGEIIALEELQESDRKLLYPWYCAAEWQAWEQEADEDAEQGHFEVFETMDDFLNEGKRVPLTREEQRLKAEEVLGDWYLVMPDKPEKLPFILMHHIRGLWAPGDLRELRKFLRGAETQEALNRIWKEFDCELLSSAKQEAIEKIKQVLQPIDDKRGDITSALDKQLLKEPPKLEELKSVWDRVVNRANDHYDWRFMDPGKKWLFGWTCTTQKMVLQDLDGKLHFLLRDRITENAEGDQWLAVKKASQPTIWASIVTPSDPIFWAEAGAIGATPETAGLFIFEGNGEYFPDVQKSDFHSYWIWWKQKRLKHLNGRWDFKIIVPTRELAKAPLEQFWMGMRPWTETGQKPYIMTHNRAEKEHDAKKEGLKGIVWNPLLLRVLEKDPLAETALKGYTKEQIQEKYDEYSADGVWPKGGPPRTGKAPVGGH